MICCISNSVSPIAERRPMVLDGGGTARTARTKRAGAQRYAGSAGSLIFFRSATCARVSVGSVGAVFAIAAVQPAPRSAALIIGSPMRPRPSVS
jgi:hypothetical protein